MILLIVLILGTIIFGFIKTVIALVILFLLIKLISYLKIFLNGSINTVEKIPYVIGSIPEYIEGTIYEIRYGFKPALKILLCAPFAIYLYPRKDYVEGVCNGYTGISLIIFMLPSFFWGFMVSGVTWIAIYPSFVQIYEELYFLFLSVRY